MIVQLSFANFKSFLEATTIDFGAGTSSKLPGNLIRVASGERFLKSMAFYGPNASGKTTVLDAIYALKSFVLFSSEDQKPTARIAHFEPFLLEKAASTRFSTVGVTINLGNDRYSLEIAATTERVWRESLTVCPVTKPRSRRDVVTPLIDRTWDPRKRTYATTLHEDLGTDLTRRAATDQTPPNRLILGKLASLNSEVARKIIEWCDDDLEFYDMHRNPFSEGVVLATTAGLLKEDPSFAANIERLMKDADTGIRQLRVVEDRALEPILGETGKTVEFRESSRPGLLFRHETRDGSEIFFPKQKESSGTLRFVALLAAILRQGHRHRVICVDELSASMHPDLVRRLIRVVQSSRYNPQGNQLLFSTHDTHLMDPDELLRRDQVTICSKDRHGRSTLRRLDQFQDGARSDANLQKQYLQGRFGGLPQFGPTLEDVPADEEPLEVHP